MPPRSFRGGEIILSQSQGHHFVPQLDVKLGEGMVPGGINLELDSPCPFVSLEDSHVFLGHLAGSRDRSVQALLCNQDPTTQAKSLTEDAMFLKIASCIHQ